MAHGHGGRRPGAGRKPKTERDRAIDGNAGKRGKVLPMGRGPASTAPPPIEEFDAPDHLTMDERRIWARLAPHAFANRTLTPAMALSFELLCQNVALMQRYAVSPTEAGGANHRGLIQRVDAELLRFNLSPCGKAVDGADVPAAPANPLDKFLKRG